MPKTKKRAVKAVPKPFPKLPNGERGKRRGELLRALKPTREPLTLEELRAANAWTYDDLALVIGAGDRGHAWRICRGQRKPTWGWARWLVGELGSAVSLETLTREAE